MRRLFQREDGSSMPFHLVDLPENFLVKFTNLIQLNGGKVEPNANPKVLVFTVPAHAYNHRYVFNVKFIEDCARNKKILDIDEYYIGDSRIMTCCPMSKFICRTKSCLLNYSGVLRTCENVVLPNEPNLQKQKQLPLQASKTTEELFPVAVTRNPSYTVNVDEQVLNEEIPVVTSEDNEQNFEPHISDSSESFRNSDEFDSVSTYYNEPKSNHEDKIKLLKYQRKPKIIKELVNNPELKEWVEDLNRNILKDADGYPRLVGQRSYSPWESRNLIKFVIKTNSYEKMHSESFWINVVKLKLVSKNRKYRSIYKHFTCQILPKIELYHLEPEIQKKFISWRNKFKARKQKREENFNQIKLAKKKKK